MTLVQRLLVLLALLQACTPAAAGPAAVAPHEPAARSASAPKPIIQDPVMPKKPASPALSFRHLQCGWGGTGVVGTGPSPAFLVGMVEATTQSSIANLRLAQVLIFDEAGNIVARVNAGLELRQLIQKHDGKYVARRNTKTFSGKLPPNTVTQLWIHGVFDVAIDSLSATPSRYQATFITSSGDPITLDGPLDPPWPTA